MGGQSPTWNKTIPLVTVAGNFGCGGGKQMWKITFQIDRRGKKKKKDTRKPQQASATAPWKSMRGTCGVLMTRSLKKRASLNGAKWRDSWNLEITDASAASACFHLWHPQHQNLVTASGLTSLCNRRPRCTLEFTNFHLCSQNLSSQRARRLDPPSVSCRAEQNAARA